MERNAGIARRRKMEQMGEVEMRDVDDAGNKKRKVEEGGKADGVLSEETMEVDGVD